MAGLSIAVVAVVAGVIAGVLLVALVAVASGLTSFSRRSQQSYLVGASVVSLGLSTAAEAEAAEPSDF